MVFALECYACHSADFKTMNIGEPEKSVGYMGGGNTLLDLRRQPIRSANLTPDAETGIGRWSERDFVTALRSGFRPDRTILRYPMPLMPDLGEDEAGAIHAYLRTIPPSATRSSATSRSSPIRPAHRAPTASASTNATAASPATARTAWASPISDRLASTTRPTRRSRRQSRSAPAIRPGTHMPGWRNVIREQDYEPLIGHVLELGKTRS